MDGETIDELQTLLDDVQTKWELEQKRTRIETEVSENEFMNPPENILDWVQMWQERLKKTKETTALSSEIWELRGEIERRSQKLKDVLPLSIPIQWGPILIKFTQRANGHIQQPQIRMVHDVTAEEDF